MSNEVVVPGVVLKARFVLPNHKAFQDYVEYVDREEAKGDDSLNQQMFSLYQDYMSNPEKTSSLFTEQSDALTKEEKSHLKSAFKQAQENNSIMWQDVISFHNPWLEEHGIYDSKTHSLDEGKLKDITRSAIKEMTKREGLSESAIWSGAIHYNTDNIHVHIAMVEPSPTRDRGKRKAKSLDAMKSKVVSHILNRGKEQKAINDLIRSNMVGRKKSESMFRWRNRELKPQFLFIYNRLPEDKRQWQYSYNSLKPLRPYIDQLSKRYIEKYHKQDYEQFIKKLNTEVDILKRAYGEGTFDRKRYEHYKKNKIDDLYKRMGNAFLKEMRDYDKERKRIETLLDRSDGFRRFKYGMTTEYALRKMQRAFKSEYESWKNQRHYERLQRDIERENERG